MNYLSKEELYLPKIYGSLEEVQDVQTITSTLGPFFENSPTHVCHHNVTSTMKETIVFFHCVTFVTIMKFKNVL